MSPADTKALGGRHWLGSSRPVAIVAGWIGMNVVMWNVLTHYDAWVLAEAHDVPFRVVRAYEMRSVEFEVEGRDRPVRIPFRYLPPPRDGSSERYPLVVFLHGAGKRGRDGVSPLRTLPTLLETDAERARRPCGVLVPQCPDHLTWSTPIGGKRDLLDVVVAMIEQIVADEPIDPDRIFLTGLSMGGYGAWSLAAKRPDLFAAVVPVCGGGDPKTAGRLRSLPLWALHGLDDQVVPPEQSREMVIAVRALGGSPLLSELEGVGHASWPHAYSPDGEVLSWMFSQYRD